MFIAVDYDVHIFVRDFTGSVTDFFVSKNISYGDCISIFTNPIKLSDLKEYFINGARNKVTCSDPSINNVYSFTEPQYMSFSSFIQQRLGSRGK